ncbi:hypothetical protein [Paenibacillus woosongensis]|uniref:hypothetical protein n=1 Tax=Paenibacillus woosongensis TaxID=307580 RepID=UPI0018C1DAEC|nr:hypothetical protein [Paenibacillus woosongensis]
MRLARELNARQNKLAREEDYDFSLQREINSVFYAISEVHSIAHMDPIDTAIHRTAFDFVDGKIKMGKCLREIERHLNMLHKGSGMKNRR